MKDFVTIRIESPAFMPDTVRVVELRGTETISRLFHFELRLVSTDPSDFEEEALLTSQVTLVFERTDGTTKIVTEERRIVGTICTLRDRSLVEAAHREVLVTFVPRAWQTTLTRTSDIFMDLSVPQIIEKKLNGCGLAAPKDVELRLEGTYAAREFTVQYKETDHDFVCRLAEDQGIHFFFEARDGRDVLVLADHNGAFKDSEPVETSLATRGDRTRVYELESTRQVVPRSFKARDYNYRNPGMDVLGEATNTSLAAAGTVDEYGPHAKDGKEAAFYARIRSEEAASRHLVFEGRSELPGLRAGSVVTIHGHPRGDLELVVTEVEHRATQASLGIGGGDDTPYANTFRAIPKATTYRPPRITPKPVVHGVVTGVVEAPASTNFGAVDEQGRYRVMFMYDTVTGRGDGKASRPLRMAQPSAAADRGFHVPLKAGTEVIITCVNGDPDRPIIAGAVPNPQTGSPVTAANAEKSIWKTNVNQIAIDDDQPRVKLTASGEDHVLQIGEPNAAEQGFVSATISNATSVANGVSTSVSDGLTAWSEWKTAASAHDITAFAGVPNPMKLWQKVEAIAGMASTFVKFMTGVPLGVMKLLSDSAKDNKKEADDAHAAAKAALAAKLKLVPVPKQVEGSMRMETPDEALDRTLAEAQEKAAAASDTKTLGEFGEVLTTRTNAATAAADVKAHETIEGEISPVLQKVDETLTTVKTTAKLFSVWSKFFAKATEDGTFLTMKAAQASAGRVPGTAGGRDNGDNGSFGKHYNIQAATNSVGLLGRVNTFIIGGAHATMFSVGRAAVLSHTAVDLKAHKLVEAAARTVQLTGTKLVDIQSDDNVLIAAHPGSKSQKPTGGVSMALHAKDSITLTSTDQSVKTVAQKDVTTQAKEGDFLVLVDKGNHKTAVKTDMNVHVEGKSVTTVKGTYELKPDGDTTISTKGKLDVTAKGDASVRSKEGLWNATGVLTLRAGKDVKVFGKKVSIL